MRIVISFIAGLCVGWVVLVVLSSPTMKDQIKGTYQNIIEGK